MIRLAGWLEETFIEQLLLGNRWLQEKNRKRAQGIKPDPESEWRDLYHDNGSCLDITNEFLPGDNDRYLQIIQLSPLTLTDGQTEVHPRLSPEHHPHLFAPTSLHGIVAVRKYTIRYTSYGPPRNKLSFILHAVDWISHVEALQSPNTAPLQPLWTEDIESVAQQLHDTRAAEDRRCLASNIANTAGAEDTSTVMDGANDGESQFHSQAQYAFSTQAAHPIRPRPSADEPQVLGVKRNEPVLAGNTQREDIRPRALAADQDEQLRLLNMLKRTSNTNTDKTTPRTPRDEFARPAPREPTTSTEPQGSQSLTQRPAVAHGQPTHTRTDGRGKGKGKQAEPSSPLPSRGTKRARESDRDSRPVGRDEAPRPPASSTNDATPKKRERNVLQQLASECSWTKDFQFTRDAFKVCGKQAHLLQQNDSWHKPPPGQQFRDGNVPIEILKTLHRFVDERAAMDGAPDSDEDLDEDPSPEDPSPQISAEDVDPSPQSSIEEADSSPESPPQPTQNSALPSSPVSWSNSPSPEPPKMSERFGQALPPDSSFDPPEPAIDEHAGKMTGAEKSAPISIESSNEKEQSVPPSSPPYGEELMVLDDDLEMEEFVPQGLGEDSVGGASELPPLAVIVSPKPKPIVQVEQTPVLAGKNTHSVTGLASPRPEKQRSSGTSKNTPSGSIVYGTYNDSHQSSKQTPKPAVDAHSTRQEDVDADRQSRSHLTDDALMTDATTLEATTAGQNKPHPLDEPTPVSAQISPATLSPIHRRNSPGIPSALTSQFRPEDTKTSRIPYTGPGATKRKLDNSPSKRNSRHTKRREIKIVGFGDIAPVAMDPTSELRHHREESFRKFQEGRRSGAGLDSRPQSAAGRELQQDGDAMEVDSRDAASSNAPRPAMSPRHVSLYEDPSPIEAAQTIITPPLNTSVASPVAAPREDLPVVSPQLHAQVTGVQQTTATAGDGPTSSVFDAFKAAYPEYTGNVKHFQGQCKQILKLNAEDKMVPNWQWDDYIIRSKIEYSQYLQKCNDEGYDPQPYHRFYKNKLGRPVYMKGVIEGEETLTMALQQLGGEPPVVRPQVFQPPVTVKAPQPKGKRSRASLPSAFNKPPTPSKSRISKVKSERDRPRHSLPAHTQVTHQTPTKSSHETNFRTSAPQPAQTPATSVLPSTRRPSLLSRLSLDSAGSSRASSVARDASEGTGDPFRDFLFAQQRMTSHTGNTKVDTRLPWPRNLEGRESVGEMLKGRGKRIDVLSWKDVL